MNTEEVHWYYIDESKNDAQIGPFVLRDFKEKFLAGILTPENFCWHEEIDDWEKLKNIQFRGKPALSYFNESPFLSKPPESIPKISVDPPVITSNPEPKIMSIEEEIKERLRKKFAK